MDPLCAAYLRLQNAVIFFRSGRNSTQTSTLMGARETGANACRQNTTLATEGRGGALQ
jgi:hypothetical protein